MIEKDIWDNLVIKHSQEFLQSYEWGEFQRSLGKRVERIKTDDFLAQVVFNPLLLGFNYGYVSRGPVFLSDDIKEDKVWEELEKIKGPKTIFFELELPKPAPFLKNLKPNTRQPCQTSILDLTQDTEKIFSSFHKMLRYDLRIAERRNMNVRQEQSWESLYELLKTTAHRQKFRNWPRIYYQRLWETLSPFGQVEIWSVYNNSKLIASNLYILFGGRVVHLFGASDHQERALMAPHFYSSFSEH